jgi:hypothetical protein
LLIFLILIFIEILECNFWGLNRNLKINIDERQMYIYYKNKDNVHFLQSSDGDTSLDGDVSRLSSVPDIIINSNN